MKNKLELKVYFFVVICVCLFVQPFYSQGIGDRNRPAGRGTYRIGGKIILPNGTPARGVTVTASGAEVNEQTSRADQDGNFVISGLSSGNYTVAVRETGYQPESELVTIPEGAISGQLYQVAIYLRLPGQPKRSASNESEKAKLAAAKYEQARELVTKGDLKGSLVLLDAAIAASPNFAGAHYEKGAVLLKLDEVDKAVECFVKAITIKPEYLEAKYGYGMAMFAKKNYEVAEAVFKDVLTKKYDLPEAHLNLGISLFYLKNLAAAETELKNLLAMKGGDQYPLAHLFLGQIHIQNKKKAEAITELEKYIDLAPKAPNADKTRAAISDLKK